MIDNERQGQPPEVHASDLGALIRDRVLGGEGITYLVAPFVTVSALTSLLQDWHGTAVMLTSWRPDHLQAGASDIDIYPLCRDAGITLYILDSLHAKLYSSGLRTAWIGSANLTQRALGLSKSTNDELLVHVDPLPMSTRVWLHGLLGRAELVTAALHAWYAAWIREFTETGRSPLPARPPRALVDPYLLNRLPAVESPSRLLALMVGASPPRDADEQHALEHDLGLFDVVACSTRDELHAQLRPAFLRSPFVRSLDDAIPTAGIRFGAVKAWLQATCTDVPVPYRGDLTSRVQTLYKWLTELASDRYQVTIPGRHSQVLRRVADGIAGDERA